MVDGNGGRIVAEVIAGRNNVTAALEADRPLIRIYVADNVRTNFQPILKLAAAKGCPWQFVPRRKLDELAPGLNHQGVIAEIAAWKYQSLEQLLQGLDLSKKPILLLLAGVEDPHNFGALLRSGECAGISGVIIPNRRSVQLTAAVARVSMGAIETVPVCRVGNLAQTVAQLKDHGFWVAAADLDGENYWRLDWDFPAVVILGGEGAGVPRLLREKSDYIVSVPTYGKLTSLNVAVAGAVLLYEIRRQRIVSNGIPNN